METDDYYLEAHGDYIAAIAAQASSILIMQSWEIVMYVLEIIDLRLRKFYGF